MVAVVAVVAVVVVDVDVDVAFVVVVDEFKTSPRASALDRSIAAVISSMQA